MINEEINDILDNGATRTHNATVQLLDYMWRKLYVSNKISMRYRDDYNDAFGYCIDRYSIDNEDGSARISRP